jgi:hypothetical protein
MSKCVWKYMLEEAYEAIEMPAGAQILTVKTQGSMPRLWVLVDPAAPMVKRTFNTYGTGHPIPDDPGIYIGTFFMGGESLVYHVFETTYIKHDKVDNVGP